MTLQDLVTQNIGLKATISGDTAQLAQLQAKIAVDTAAGSTADAALATANKAAGGASGPYADTDGSAFAVVNDDSPAGWHKLVLAAPTTAIPDPAPAADATKSPAA